MSALPIYYYCTDCSCSSGLLERAKCQQMAEGRGRAGRVAGDGGSLADS